VADGDRLGVGRIAGGVRKQGDLGALRTIRVPADTGMSYGASMTWPPLAVVVLTAASTLSTETYAIQCDGPGRLFGVTYPPIIVPPA
jgi:hypothetical protein